MGLARIISHPKSFAATCNINNTHNLDKLINDDHLLAKAHIDSVMNGRKIKRVLFVNPPDVDESIFDYDVAKRGRGNNYPSYGIGILTAQLSRLGYETDIINLNHELLKKVYYSKNSKDFNYLNEWQDLIDEKVKKFKPDIIGVSCLFSVTHNSFKKVCKYIKNNFQNLPVIVGGVHVSHDLDGVFKDLDGVDFVCMYEADLALPNLFNIINGKKDIKDLAQFAFKSKDKIVSFKKRLVPDGHTMSVMPAYEKMDIKDHSKYGTIGSWHGMLKKDIVVSTAQSNRGCRASCTFCNVRTYHGKTVRHRTVDSVVDELLRLQNDYGVDPGKLVAAGRSFYMPIADNDSRVTRARNRRTRIVVLPKLDQFFNLIEEGKTMNVPSTIDNDNTIDSSNKPD